MKHPRTLWILAIAESLVLLLLVFLWFAEDPEAASGPGPAAPQVANAPEPEAAQPDPFQRDTTEPQSAAEARSPAPPDAVDAAWVYTSDDPVGLIVTGTVRDAAGNAIQGASVRFQRERTTLRGGQRDDPFYRVLGLAPGRWQVTASCPVGDWLETQVWLELDGESPHTTLDLTLQPAATAEVSLIDANGAPWRPTYEELGMPPPTKGFKLRHSVLATEEPLPGRFVPRSFANLAHSKRIPGDFSRVHRELRARAPLPLHVSFAVGERVLARARWEPGQSQIRIEVSRAAVRAALAHPEFQVVDAATREPLGGATVRLSFAELPTDAEGRARLAGLPPGMYPISAQGEGHAPEVRHLELEPGRGPAHVFALTRPRRVSGRILNPDGTAQPNARLSLTPLRRFEAPVRTWADGVGSPIGNRAAFDWTTGTGRYLLRAYEYEQGSTTMLVDTTAGSVEGLEVRLRPTFRVVFQSAGIRFLVVRDRDGLPVFWERVWGETDVWLPAGSWRVESHDAATLQGSFTLTVPTSESALVEVP